MGVSGVQFRKRGLAMASGKEQSSKRRERLVPNIAQASSRVSNVVGGESLRGKRVEQRASAPSTKTKARASARGSGARNGSAKKNPTPARAAPSPTPAPAGGPADSRIIARGLNGWNNLEPHHQQRILGVGLLALALLLFASLTIF